MQKIKNMFARGLAKILVFLIGAILGFGLLSYGLVIISENIASQYHKIEICTYYQDNATKTPSNYAGTISVNGNIANNIHGKVGNLVNLAANTNENYQFVGFYRDIEFTNVISRDETCTYEINQNDSKIFAQFLRLYPVTFTFQDANFNTHTITKNFPFGYTFGQKEIMQLIEQKAGQAGILMFKNKLAKLNPLPGTATDTTHTSMCFTVGSSASFFNLTVADLDDIGLAGSGTAETPYLIGNATDLATFRDMVNSTPGAPLPSPYAIKNNPNLPTLMAAPDVGGSGSTSYICGKLTADITLSGAWWQIGDNWQEAYIYAGTFDGDFYSVKGLSFSGMERFAGFFGECEGAVIKNLKIVGGGVSSSWAMSTMASAEIGGIIGRAKNTKIINCSSTASVSAAIAGVGGICGYSIGSTFVNCVNGGSVKCTLTSSINRVGGICGNTSGNTYFYNCYNYGTTESGYVSDNSMAGIVGSGYSTAQIVNCYSMSGVAGDKINGSTACGVVKGASLFNASTQVLASTISVYNVTTDAEVIMSSSTKLLQALNKFVELNPTIEGVGMSTWVIKATYPEFGYSGWVSFDANGGSGAPSDQPIINEQVTIPLTLPNKEDYYCIGWHTDQTNSTVSFAPGGTYNLPGSITVYAVWRLLEYTINYYDGDSLIGYQTVKPNELTSLTSWSTLLTNYGVSASVYAQFGWNFTGWSESTTATTATYSNGQQVTNIAQPGETINLYAVHTQTLNLVYDGNGSTGGTVSAQNISVYLNSSSKNISNFAINLMENAFVKKHHTFSKWALTSTSGIQFSAGATVTQNNISLTYNGVFTYTFYAVWQGNSYTINYYNGTSKVGSISYTYGTNSTLKAFDTFNGSVLNSGYGWQFYGWSNTTSSYTRLFADQALITHINLGDDSEITQGRTINLYAIYSRTINFVSGLHTNIITTTAEQYWNSYSTAIANYSSVIASPPQTISENGWIALGYRADLTAGTATYIALNEVEIKPAVNALNTLYAVYSRTIIVADLNTTTTITQHYNSVGTISTVNG